ncbi:MAG TPA: sigma-70 family RNA polymerase sigma factor [Iamia sp.]
MSGLQIEGAAPPEATPTADVALVAGLVARDPAAVADLYDRYADRLLGFCTGMLRDPHEAADALHDTILVAAERIGQLRDPERLRPWLYAIARTQCLSRLRRRERTALSEDPTELAGGRAMTADTGPEGDGARVAEGGEAAELVWAAAEGLDEGDRVLLELHLRQGLTGGELAAAAGVKPGQISMVTGRMRERLERALGALLVARHGRRDCDELDGILRDWDGRLTVLMRKRVARHLDRCAVCDDRRSGLVAPLGSLAIGAPVVLATTDLRAAIVAGAEKVWGGAPAPDVTGTLQWDADGFPPDPPGGEAARRADRDDTSPLLRRRAALAAAAALILLIGGLVAWRSTASPAEDDVRADGGSEQAADAEDDDGGTPRSGDLDATTTTEAGPTTTTTTTSPVPTTPGTTPVQPGSPTTTTPPLDGGSGGPAAGPTAPDGGGGLGTGTAPPATSPAPPPPNPAPSISGHQLSPASFQTTCNPANDSAEASVVVTDSGGALSVRLFHTGPGGASGYPMTLSGGRYRATIQGFTTPGTYSWRVQASDGTSTTSAGSWSFAVDPCPG